MLALGLGPNPHARGVDRLERAGLGPPMPRACVFPRMREVYRRAYGLTLAVAATSIEEMASEPISQPFRVDDILVTNNGAGVANARWIIAAERDNPTAGGLGSAFRRNLIRTIFEGQTNQEIGPFQGGYQIPIGSIVRQLPCRLVLVVDNASAAAIIYSAVVSVTFLDEWPYERPE